MSNSITPSLIYEFLSGARVFAKAVRDVIEGAVLQEVAGNKLSMPQLKLLYLFVSFRLGDDQRCSRLSRVSSPAASKTVEKLVRRRLLRRNDIQEDRRSATCRLPQQGAVCWKRTRPPGTRRPLKFLHSTRPMCFRTLPSF